MAKTILLADDSVTIRKVVELTFMDEDYEVVAVASGDEALAQLDAVAPDIIIADIHMPGADGYEVTREAKAKRPEVPVLLLVGTFEQFDPEDVAACGAEKYLKKPFDSQELLRLVEELLAAAPAAEPELPAMDASFAFDDEPPPTQVSPPAEVGRVTMPLPEAEELSPPLETESVSVLPSMEESPFELSPADDEASELMAASPEPWQDDFGSAPEDLPEPELEPEPEEPSFDDAELPEPAFSAPEIAEPEVSTAELEEPAAAAFEPEEIGELSEEEVDRIARRVIEYLTDDVVRDLAWEILPDLAEIIVRARLRELEGQVE